MGSYERLSNSTDIGQAKTLLEMISEITLINLIRNRCSIKFVYGIFLQHFHMQGLPIREGRA